MNRDDDDAMMSTGILSRYEQQLREIPGGKKRAVTLGDDSDDADHRRHGRFVVECRSSARLTGARRAKHFLTLDADPPLALTE